MKKEVLNSKNIIILLSISMLLNTLLFGFIIGTIFNRGMKPPHRRGGHPIHMLAGKPFSREEARKIHDTIDDYTAALKEIIIQEKFDKVMFKKVFKDMDNFMKSKIEIRLDKLISEIEGKTFEERKNMLNHIDNKGRRK